VPARGHSGGLITGVKGDEFELEQTKYGAFFLATLIRNRKTNHRFLVLDIYGPAQHHLSADFLQEVQIFCASEQLPILMGDFNLIRNNKERNQGQGDPNLMRLFNNFIGDLHLREIFVSGVKFTWSNKQKKSYSG
jgi:hypothetical protein